jgi:beta-lactam-binding protein with PASTA domain
MLIAFVVIIVCAFIGVRAVFVENRSASVPEMVGMQLADAADSLQKQGLLAKFDRVDSPEPADTVVSQSLPSGEKVSKGKVIILRVSKGGAIAPIPDVRGMTFEEGIRKLGESGFKVSSIMRVADKTKPAGSIIAQNPEAPQQVAANCMVSLLVSVGSKKDSSFIYVPDLRGQSQELAKQMLEQSGLVLGSSSETPSSSVPAGAVLSTNPRNGAKVPAGSTVNIVCASEPQNDEVTSDEPPANDETKARSEAVRTVVVKNAAPEKIPSKIPDKKASKPAKQTAAADKTKRAAAPAQAVKENEKTAAPAAKQTPKQDIENKTSGQKKTAKVRYQVPPLAKPLTLKITMTDSAGTRVLKDEIAKNTEYVSLNVPYTGNAKIMIILGGAVVWQDHFN